MLEAKETEEAGPMKLPWIVDVMELRVGILTWKLSKPSGRYSFSTNHLRSPAAAQNSHGLCSPLAYLVGNRRIYRVLTTTTKQLIPGFLEWMSSIVEFVFHFWGTCISNHLFHNQTINPLG